MGLRWPWTREPAERPAPEVSAAAPADPAPSPMGWAFLPPIQRTLDTPIAPVTRPTAFPAELPTWRSPAFTSALSHAVVDTVPGGVVDGDGGGLGEPSHTVGPAPELTLLPPPRPTAALQRSVAAPAPTEEPAAPAAVAGERPEPGEPDVVRPEVPAPTLTRAPSAGMPVVHRSVVSEPLPLEPPEPSAPAADVAPSDNLSDRPPLGPIAAAPEPQSPAPGPGEVGRPAVVQRSEVGRPAVVQRSTAAPLAPRATPAAPMPVQVQRAATLGVSASAAKPRLGLGAPLVSTPPTAVPTPPDPAPDSGQIPPESGEIPRESGEIAVESAGLDGNGARFDGNFSRFAEKAAHDGFTEVPIQRALGPAAAASPSRSTPAGSAVQPPVDLPAPDLTLARSVDPAAEPPPPPVADPAPSPAAGVAPAEESPDASPAAEVVDVPSAAEAPEPNAVPDAAAAVTSPPTLLPSAPLPLAAGLATSIQRADLLPGPGTPTPSLTVRPAPMIPPKPQRERVVPIQRLPLESAHLGTERSSSRHMSERADSTIVAPGPVQRSASPYALATSTGPDATPSTADVSNVVLPGIRTHTTPPDAARPAEVTSALPAPFVSRSVTLAPTRAARPETSPTIVSRSTTSPVSPTMPLAAPPAPPSTSVSVQAAADDELVESAGAEPAAGPTPVEGTRASPAGPGAVTVQTAVDPAAAPAAPAAAPGKAGGGASATGDVDALAQKLFPAVLRRIKAELLLDRERRGLRTDPW